jgi:hypothetical protein
MDQLKRTYKLYNDVNCTVIGVHARRGDFLSDWNRFSGYIAADKNYVN